MSLSSRSQIPREERQTSPLKQPPRRFSLSPTKRVSERPPSPLKEPPRRPPRKYSFASPTKPSLARGNSDLLQRPKSPGPPDVNGRADMLARGKQARAFILGDKTRDSRAAREDNGRTKGETAAEAQIPSPVPRQDTTPRTQRTKALATNTEMDEEEEDLPATPSQKTAEEQYTARPGLFSSPSKRPPRLKKTLGQSSLQKDLSSVEHTGPDVTLDEPLEDAENETRPEGPGKQQPPDPIIEEKKREKARLVKELKELEEQVLRCTKEIPKHRADLSSSATTREERETLINLVNSLDSSEDDAEESHQPISTLLSSFLPCSTRHIAPPKPISQAPIASHRPLELDDPLPYLQMFTPFKFTTTLSLPRDHNPHSNRVHQNHVIDVTGPQSLLTAQLTLTIDTLTNTILDLNLTHISHWAERELGAFIRAKAVSRDLGNACWAMDSYWGLARKRAEYWRRCEVAFAHLIPGRMRSDTGNVEVVGRGELEKKISRKELNRHLGGDVLVLEDRHVVLKISWKISFDWTGEAASSVGVVAVVPRVCKCALFFVRL